METSSLPGEDFAVILQTRPPETRAETERFIEFMSSLVEHPGWKIYAARVRMIFETERAAMTVVKSAADVALMPVKAGRVRAIEMLMDWPLVQAKASQEAIKEDTEKPGTWFTVVDNEPEK